MKSLAEDWCDRSGFMDPTRLTSEKGYNLRDRLNNLKTVDPHPDDPDVFFFSDGSGIEIASRGAGDHGSKWGLI